MRCASRTVVVVASASLLLLLLLLSLLTPEPEALQAKPRHKDTRGEEDDSSWPSSLLWTGGGVKGPDVAAVERFLEEIFQRRLVRRNVTATSIASNLWQGDLLTIFEELAVDLSDDISNPVESSPSDCIMHLMPQQRAACLLFALLDGEDRNAPLSQRQRTYHNSYCSALAPCLLWGRGTFAKRMQSEELRSLFARVEGRVAGRPPSQAAAGDEEASRVIDRLFVLRGDPAARGGLDISQFSRRLADHETFVANREAMLAAATSAVAMPVVNTTVAARDVLDGIDVRYSEHRGGRVFLRREAGGDSPMAYLTPAEVLSVLHHHCDPPTEDGRGKEGRKRPRIVAFSGDSMVREVFFRLVHFLRFGDPATMPVVEPSQWHDMLYVVFPTHDELMIFHSPTSNPSGTSTHTIDNYFASRRRKQEEERAESLHRERQRAPEPLAYVAYYWNPKSSDCRPDLLVKGYRYLSKTIAGKSTAIVDSTFRSNEAGRSLLLLGTQRAHEAQGLNPGKMSFPFARPEYRAALERALAAVKVEGSAPRGLPRPLQLRSRGVGIAVHFLGHMFWDKVHDKQLFQQLAAEALATHDDDAESDIADQTDLYVASATMEDRSEPHWRRALNPAASHAGINTAETAITNGSTTPMSDAAGETLELEDGDIAPNASSSDAVEISPAAPAPAAVEDSAFVFQPRHHILRVNRENLLKNEFLARWAHVVLSQRESVKNNATATAVGNRENALGVKPFRFVRSLALFDLSKVQLLGFHQGDNRHFQCRFSQLLNRAGLELSFSESSLRLLLTSGSVFGDTEALSAHHDLFTDRFIKLVARFVFRHQGFVRRMFHISGLGLVGFKGRDNGGDAHVLHVLGRMEYGVLLHDDMARCRDHANLFAIQLLMRDMAVSGRRR